ncbi:MAG: NAD-dependent deacylase [Bacteroidia bacterium]|nr:NAD-dependent deacylase [Bacteroidia bacterium]
MDRNVKKLVVFTGAGVSEESGLKTFRDSGGLWEEYNVMDVATPEAWEKNPALVLEFYNKRRRQILEARPNRAHNVIASLQDHFDVQVITQNIDNLHERAGSKHVLHLHGEITKSRSSADPKLIYSLRNDELKMGQLCEKGSQLRPHIVWFGEIVPNIEEAQRLSSLADIFVIVGTSLNVYPAAGLVDYAPYDVPKFVVDPNHTRAELIPNLEIIRAKAGEGMEQLLKELMQLK